VARSHRGFDGAKPGQIILSGTCYLALALDAWKYICPCGLYPMRIAQVAPLAESVPPKLYGGTERVVSWLTEELIALGHDVTLFASGDSVTRGTLVPIIPRAIRLSRPRPDPFPAYAMQLDAIVEAAADFDIVHCHIDWLHLPVLNRLGIPHLTTIPRIAPTRSRKKALAGIGRDPCTAPQSLVQHRRRQIRGPVA
jgi:Glycosyltransferase Family 4